MIKKLWRNEFLRGGFVLTGATFLGNILNYFFNLIVARILGPQGLGEITSLFSYVTILSVPISVTTTFLTQKISAAESDAYALTHSLEQFFWIKIKKWWYIGLPFLLFVPFISQLTRLQTITSYSIPLIITTSLASSFYLAAFAGLKLFFLVSLFGMIGVFLKLIGAVLVFVGIDGIATVIISLTFSSAIGSLLPYYMMRKILKKNVRNAKTYPPTRRLMHLIFSRFFLITAASMIAITIFNNIDIVIVKRNFSGFDAGIYSSWALFAKIISFAVGPITSVSFVFFANSQNKLHQKTLNFSLYILLIIGVAAYGIYRYYGTVIIPFFFGDKFAAVIPYLGKASVFGTLYTTILFINMFFLAKKSAGALILPVSLPLYIGILTLQKQLPSIMNTTIVFSSCIAVVYVLFYVYNTRQWNKNRQAIS